MEIVIFWMLCGVVGAAILQSHNKAGTGCLAGTLLGPIGILLAWIEDLERENIRAAELRSLARSSQPALPTPRNERDCPHCAERILAQAKICKHCGRGVADGAVS